MYKLLLISKYLRRKLAPLFAAVSVSFCTAMVIIVVSVMGGFLDLMRTTAKTLSGDVMVQSNLTPGFPHYDELAQRIETLDGVELATPVVETFALMRIGNRDQVVQVVGIVPDEMSKIINYNESLLWTGDDLVGSQFSDLDDATQKRLSEAFDLARAGQRLEQTALLQLLLSDIAANQLRQALIEDDTLRARFAPTLGPLLVNDAAATLSDRVLLEWLTDPQAEGYVLSNLRGALLRQPALLETPGLPKVSPAPALVIGVAVNPYHRRDKRGQYSFDDPETGYPNSIAGATVSLTLVPFSPAGELAFEPVRRDIAVVNEFKSGFYQTDQNVVYAPLGWLQEQLQMQRSEDTTDYNEFTGQGGEAIVTPARAHNIIVKAAGEQDADQLAREVQQVVNDFYKDHPDVPITLTAITWEQKHGALLGAVQNEKGLVTFLFAIISIVAIVMVATTFYMIVLEKTRDIGVLRAIGAPASGVLGMFLTYGLVIGVVGTGLGVWIGWAVVTNLNNIQEALANRMATLIGVVIIAAVIALAVTIVTAWQRRHREFGIGTGILLFFAVAAALLTVVYYAFPSITLPIAHGIDPNIGWRMWDPQTYYFERIPDRINWAEVLWISIGAVVSCVIGAAIPAIIAALLNPIEALRYE
ncbi:MAG: FtsX-like permease family protein [Planctomycetota bacterium]